MQNIGRYLSASEMVGGTPRSFEIQAFCPGENVRLHYMKDQKTLNFVIL